MRVMTWLGSCALLCAAPLTADSTWGLGLTQPRQGPGRVALVPQVGHVWRLTAAAFSPDGRLLATGERLGPVILWDAETGVQIRTFLGHRYDVAGLALSPDGTVLASSGRDKWLVLWDALTGDVLERIDVDYEICAMAFTPDGSALVTTGDGGEIRVLNPLTAEEALRLEGHTRSPYTLAVSQDGQMLVSAERDSLIVWDLAAKLPRRTYPLGGLQAWQVAADSEGHAWAVGHRPVVTVWNLAEGRLVRTVQTGAASKMAVSPDGGRIATGDKRGGLVLWDVETGERTGLATYHSEWITALAFSADGRRLVSCGDDKQAALWDAETGARLAELEGLADEGLAAAWDGEGKLVATASDSRAEAKIALWDAATGELLRSFEPEEVTCLGLSPDGRWLAAGREKAAVVYDTATGEPMHVLEGYEKEVSQAVFGPDSRALAVVTSEPVLRVWDATNGEVIRSWEQLDLPVSTVAFTADGQGLVTYDWTRKTSVLDLATGERHEGKEIPGTSPLAMSADGSTLMCGAQQAVVFSDQTGEGVVRELEGLISTIECMAVTGEGRKVAAGTGKGSVIVWDAETGQRLRTDQADESYVAAVAFSPDGRRLVTGADDCTTIIWDTETGGEVRRLQRRRAGISGIALSPDASFLAVLSWDQALHVWDTESGRHTWMVDWEGSREGIAISPDGKTIAVVGSEGRIVLHDAGRGEPVGTLDSAGRWTGPIAFSPDGRLLAVLSGRNQCDLWDVATGEKVRTLARPEPRQGPSYVLGYRQGIAFSTDGALLALGGAADDVLLWDAATGELRAELSESQEEQTAAALTTGVAFSADGRQVWSASAAGAYRVWDVASGELVRRIGTEWTQIVMDAAFDPSRGLVAIASRDTGDIDLWRPQDGTLQRLLVGHPEEVECLAVSRDGRRLASGSLDGTVKLWDLATGAPLATFWSIPTPWERVEVPTPGHTWRTRPTGLWVAWTEDGYYECTEGAEEFFLFRDGFGKMHPPEELADELHRPERLAEALKAR
jgi:WD40 repeat protein